jgi:hypothetical protein
MLYNEDGDFNGRQASNMYCSYSRLRLLELPDTMYMVTL